MKVLKTKDKNFPEQFRRLVSRNPLWKGDVEKAVRAILKQVEKEGDKALLKLTWKFDGVRLAWGELEVSAAEARKASRKIVYDELASLKKASRRIEAFHRRYLPKSLFRPGKRDESLGQVVKPLERVGIYVPGGKAAYPSTVLMNAIPAKVAGVEEIIMVTPPGGDGINPYVLAAAKIAGVKRIFKVGGAQAIAALAFGTKTIPRVDKIVGPGNIYVATAKRMLYSTVGVDLVAGPSEILVVTDGSCDPSFVASDLLSQAEHDEQAISILIATSPGYANRVKNHLISQLSTLRRREIAAVAIRNNGAIVIARDMSESIDLANQFAPEHLELAVKNPESLLPRIRNAGSIFLGSYTPEAVGDYMAGPNHVLPTGGTARFFSPLGVEDFITRSNVIFMSKKRLKVLGEDVMRIARIEGLEGHARSIELRLKK